MRLHQNYAKMCKISENQRKRNQMLFSNIFFIYHFNFSAGVAVINGQVFVVGGFSGSLRVRTVDAYDPVKDTWLSCPSMKARRSTLGVALLNDLIYAVGGFDGSSGDNSFNFFHSKPLPLLRW